MVNFLLVLFARIITSLIIDDALANLLSDIIFFTFTKSQSMQEIMSDSKLAKASSIINEVMILANKTRRKFTTGYKETINANQMGAVESIVFSDKIIQENDEQEMMDFLNDAENKGVKIYSVDSSTDIGLRVSGLGGIVSLLRYAVES